MKPIRARTHPWLTLLLCAAGLLAACAPAAQAGDEPVSTTSVSMPPSYLFQPASIAVTAGDTVTWTNSDHFTHNVHVLGETDWRSEVVPPGESVSYAFAAPGEYFYQCDFHPQDMTGTVIVAAP
jgi:plastocyanin